MKAATQREQPSPFDYSTPESVHAAHDITAVEKQARAEGRENVNLGKTRLAGSFAFSCLSIDASIYVVKSGSPEIRNPPIARSLNRMELDTAVVNEWIPKTGRDKMDPPNVARGWINDNMENVNGWINGTGNRSLPDFEPVRFGHCLLDCR